jgi:flagellar hook-basal body complex protein FliE
MVNMNAVNLIDQMRAMTAQAEGKKPEEVDGQNSFGSLFQQALGQASSLDQKATDLTTRLQLGDPDVSLSDAMIGVQKAGLGFQGALMVRNKVVQAYQDVINMSV